MEHRSWWLVAAIMIGGVVVALFGEVIWGAFHPDPCPSRTAVDTDREDFPEMSAGTKMGRANAVPSFARQHEMDCASCHTAVPHLNSMGREFKQAGYQIPGPDEPDFQGQRQIGETYLAPDESPFSVVGESTLFETSSETDLTTDPIAAVKLLFGGSVFDGGSAYMYLDYHDGHIGAGGRLGAHPSPYLNLYAGIGDPFDIDPYNTLHGHELTAAHAHGTSPYAAVSGRADSLYYSVGAAGGEVGTQLTDEWATTGRLAYDVVPEVQVGLLGRFGQEPTAEDIDDDHQHLSMLRQAHQVDDHDDDHYDDHDDDHSERQEMLEIGADTNIAVDDNLHLLGLAELEMSGDGLDETAFTGSTDVYYTYMADNRPLFMPLAGLEYERASGEDTVSVVGNVSSYLVSNARVGLEYDQQLVVPEGHDRAYQFTGFAHWQW